MRVLSSVDRSTGSAEPVDGSAERERATGAVQRGTIPEVRR